MFIYRKIYIFVPYNTVNINIKMETTIEYICEENIGKYWIENSLVATLDFNGDEFIMDDEARDNMTEEEVDGIYFAMTEYKEQYNA